VLKQVKIEKINYLIPLTDLDVDFFSKNLSFFKSLKIKILVENDSLVQALRSKRNFNSLLSNCQQIKCIPTYSKNEFLDKINKYPVIVKKETGRSSEGLYKLSYKDQLVMVDDDYIIQPYIKGCVVTVDIINNNKKAVWIQRKEIFRTANGAGTTVEIVNNLKINNAVQEFLKITKYAGVLNIEFLVTSDEQVYLMDINPRFSAGIAFSKFAGYDFVKNSFKILEGEDVDNLSIVQNGLIVAKDYDEIIF